MLERMKELLASHRLGVLATSKNDQPHCSLMSYAVGPDGLNIYFLTRKDSRKYLNLLENPRVSFLVDTRSSRGDTPIRALTVTAIHEPGLKAPDREFYQERLLEQNPQLRPLSELPNTVVVRLRVLSFLLLEGPTEAFYREVGNPDRPLV